MAYLYTHTRLDNGVVFYVGIGTQDNYKRASFNYNRTNYWKNIAKKCGWKAEIVFDNLTWKDACKKEVELILKYGRVDLGTGTLVNLTCGGEGTLGRPTTDKTRKKMSESRNGKIKLADSTKNKISKSMFGKNCKKIINTSNGIIYNSVTEAAKDIGISRTALSNILIGITKNKMGLNYYK